MLFKQEQEQERNLCANWIACDATFKDNHPSFSACRCVFPPGGLAPGDLENSSAYPVFSWLNPFSAVSGAENLIS
jgi:hypothetical protein